MQSADMLRRKRNVWQVVDWEPRLVNLRLGYLQGKAFTQDEGQHFGSRNFCLLIKHQQSLSVERTMQLAMSAIMNSITAAESMI